MELTTRERKVLELAAAGKQSKQIAYELGMREWRVAWLRCLIADKLGTKNISDWKRVAVEKGLLPA